MPLDPQARAFLDRVAAAGLPSVEQMTVEEARAANLRLARLAGPPAPVAGVVDRTIPGPAGALPIRIYTPAGTSPFPALVYFHGGGWVVGTLDVVDGPCRALAVQAGRVVISVDYRLAPEHQFPAGLEDAYAATAWVAAQAAELGVDPAHLAVGGDSAGGNLAAAVTLLARDRGGPPLDYQLLIYPATDRDFTTASYLANADGYFLTRNASIWFWGHYLGENQPEGPVPAADNPYVAPLRSSDLSGLPPALVITAEYDPLRDEGEAYAEKLRAAGVPVQLTRYDGLTHGFFQLAGVLDAAKQAIAEAAAALRQALGKEQ